MFCCEISNSFPSASCIRSSTSSVSSKALLWILLVKVISSRARCFLCDDTGMIFDVCRRCHLTAQLGNIERTAHFFQFSPLRKLLRHGQDIDRLLIHGQIGNSRIYQLMSMLIKRLRTKNFTYQRISVLFQSSRLPRQLLPAQAPAAGNVRIRQQALLSSFRSTCHFSRFCHCRLFKVGQR